MGAAKRKPEKFKPSPKLLQDVPTLRGAKDIADKFRSLVALLVAQRRSVINTVGELRFFHEVIVSACIGIAVIFVSGTVEFIGPALGHERHLCSRRSTLLSVVI